MAEVLAALKPILQDPLKPKVGQHGKYDLHVLRRHGLVVQGYSEDTMLESFIYDPVGEWAPATRAFNETQQRTQHIGEILPAFRVNRALRHSLDLIFNRIFDRHDVPGFPVDTANQRVERC